MSLKSLKTMLGFGQAAASDAVARLKEVGDIPLPTQDNDLPLGGRIGAMMRVDPGQIYVAQTLGSFVTHPDLGELTIVAISRLKPDGWPDKKRLYRYYLDTGESGEAERFVQITSEDGNIKEILYFTTLERKTSGDDVDGKPWWMVYDGSLGFGLGELKYTYQKGELKALLSPHLYGTIPSDTQEFVWERSIDGDGYIKPIHVRENRIDDSVGNTGLSQRTWFMPYARAVDGTLIEHLWISLEVVLADDGEIAKDVHVDYMVGIPLPATALSIV